MKFGLSLHVLVTVLLPLAISGHRGNGSNSQQSGESAFDITTFSGDGLMDNLTLSSCAARTIEASQLTPYSAAVTYSVKAFWLLYYSPLFILGTFLNTLVIYLVARHKKLQILPFIITSVVMAANLLIMIAYTLPALVTAIAGEWVFGVYMCAAFGLLAITSAMIRTVIMSVFVIDRFLSVFFAFFYLRHKVKIAVGLSVFVWVLMIACRLPTLPSILDCIGFVPLLNTCHVLPSCNGLCSVYGLLFFVLIALPATTLAIVLYTALYCKARRLWKSTSSNTADGGGMSKEERERERRVTITFFLLFLTIFATNIPAIAVLLMIHILFQTEVPSWVYVVQVLVGAAVSLNLVMDPIVIMRNKDVLEILSQVKAKLVKKCQACIKRQ